MPGGRTMFQRHHRSRVTVARGSALEMEIRRGRFRLSLLGEPEQVGRRRGRIGPGGARRFKPCAEASRGKRGAALARAATPEPPRSRQRPPTCGVPGGGPRVRVGVSGWDPRANAALASEGVQPASVLGRGLLRRGGTGQMPRPSASHLDWVGGVSGRKVTRSCVVTPTIWKGVQSPDPA